METAKQGLNRALDVINEDQVLFRKMEHMMEQTNNTLKMLQDRFNDEAKKLKAENKRLSARRERLLQQDENGEFE